MVNLDDSLEMLLQTQKQFREFDLVASVSLSDGENVFFGVSVGSMCSAKHAAEVAELQHQGLCHSCMLLVFLCSPLVDKATSSAL